MQTFSTYRENNPKKNMVSGNDIAAFNWINENLGDDCHILNNAAKNNRSYIVYASDGAAWISVFTDCEIAMPFTEFSSVTTHQNLNIIQSCLMGRTLVKIFLD
jgi:argonaute-like protein implicated in RNA metabolism and viral defense